jgi:hypothetical protein
MSRKDPQCWPAIGQIAGQWRQVENGAAHRLPAGGAAVWSGPRVAGGGVQADCRQVGLLPVSLAPLHRRQFAGPSSPRSVKPATKRRRRQCRAAPGGDRRQAVPGRRRDGTPAADRGCRGWAGCRGAAGVRQVAAGVARAGGLDHWQFGRVFVLSIGEAGHKATTAPGSSGAWWRSPASGPGRRREAHRLPIGRCRGLVRLSAGMRLQRPPGLPPAWSVLAALDHRQFGRAFVLSIGEAGRRSDNGARVERCLVAIAGKWCQVEGETAQRLPIGRAVACQALGVRAIQAVAAGVAAGSARSPAVRSGLRPLDR